MYDDLKKAVEKLHAYMPHPLKKEAIGYVLDLFALQAKNPNALRPNSREASLARSESMKKAWAKRREKIQES